jgi:CubicO group peptidase (beta-lactamase class C family)
LLSLRQHRTRFARIAWLATFALAAVYEVAAQTAPPPDLIARIDSFVEAERTRSRIPGIALAIVQDGTIVHARGFGTRGAGEPVSATTPFPIGSLTKSFTAVLVRQLADAGRIDVDAPLQRYLSWFKLADAEASARITVRQLLNQTSGLSRTVGVQLLLDSSDANIEQLARRAAALPLTTAPGERYQYSNMNFVLLGALVEAVLEKRWADAVRDGVFVPLNMGHSYTDFESARRAGSSALHRYWFGTPATHTPEFASGLAPAGGLVASAEDMAKYLAAMLGDGQGQREPLLSPQAVRAMFTPSSPPGQSELLSTQFNFRYGEGWFVGPFGAVEDARWHLGNLTAFAAWMVVLPRTRQGVVVLMNANCELPLFGASSTFSRIPVGIVDLLAGKQVPTGPSVADAYFKANTVGLLVGLGLIVLAWWGARRGSRWFVGSLAVLAAAVAIWIAVSDLGWKGFMQFAPDISLWLASILLALLAPAAYRMARMWGSRR